MGENKLVNWCHEEDTRQLQIPTECVQIVSEQINLVGVICLPLIGIGEKLNVDIFPLSHMQACSIPICTAGPDLHNKNMY